MAAAISVNNLNKRYGDFLALKDITLEIGQGEYFGLLGPNGAGKSTLINIVAGLVRATSGTAAVLGHDVRTDYRAARRNLGVVPQELVYDPFFEVRDMLRIQAGYYGCGRDFWPWIDQLLEELDLTDKSGHTLRQLSGGMKRRVLIAQALVHKPEVVILDEPTAGVDVELRRALWRFTRQLHEQGHTIVLTTHYLEEAESLCERIGILDHGELRELEHKQALLDRHPFKLLSIKVEAMSRIPDSLSGLVIDQSGNRLELKLERNKHSIPDVLDEVRAAGLKILDVKTRDPNLEDIFVELTSRKGRS